MAASYVVYRDKVVNLIEALNNLSTLPEATVAALMAAFLMPIAQAQKPNICQPHAEVNRTLLNRYQEVVIAMGLAGNALFELYVSKSGTWTVVVTRPSMNNLPCIQEPGPICN